MSKRNVQGQGAQDRTNQLSAEERDGIRIGARVRFREMAKDALETAAAVAAATGTPIDWQSEWTNRETDETFTLADARELLEAAPRRYAPLMNRERMTDAELLGIGTAAASATAAAINRKAARSARLSDEEYAELRSWLLAEAVEAGAPRWRKIEGNAEAEAAAGTAGRAAEPSTLRGRWIGYLILRGREWRAERAERMAAEVEAEAAERQASLLAEGTRLLGPGAAEAEAVEAGKHAEQTRNAMAEVEAASATVEAVAERLEAVGRTLGKAERMTLTVALTGLSRREAAERFGVTADTVKRTLHRGRAALAERWPDAATARREVRAAADASQGDSCLPGCRADVLRMIDTVTGNAERMEWLREAVADGWQDVTRKPTVPYAERIKSPRKGRRILRVQPRPLALPPLAWAHRRAATLAAQEARINYTAQGFPLQDLAAYIG
jgi:DNA-directed RNA polymerase specialized sigma24 family protein